MRNEKKATGKSTELRDHLLIQSPSNADGNRTGTSPSRLPEQPLCFKFIQRRCNKGNKCPFLHSEKDKSRRQEEHKDRIQINRAHSSPKRGERPDAESNSPPGHVVPHTIFFESSDVKCAFSYTAHTFCMHIHACTPHTTLTHGTSAPPSP